MEHKFRFTRELLSTHKAEVMRVCVLPLLRVVVMAVREVSPSAGLVDNGCRGDGGGGRYMPIQDLLVLIVVVQKLELLLVR